jgi:cell division protease FtsH
MNSKNIIQKTFIWLFVILIVVFGYTQIQNSINGSNKYIIMSDFIDFVDSDQVLEVKIKQNQVSGKLKDGSYFKTNLISYDGFIKNLRDHGVKIEIITSDGFLFYLGSILLSWLPMLFLIGIWIFFIGKIQAGGSKALGFAKSKAKLFGGDLLKIKLSDVGGIKEAKEELVEIIDFLKNPTKYQALGGKIPRGVLLIGTPGTGKTLLAKAIAGEASVPFFSISGSDFVEMFVGVGASRVRDMFSEAKKHSPCLIFIDEVDAVGRHRGIGIGGGNDEREQTLNQLLVEMDGFETNSGVIVIAATNRPDVLDPALLRPGRFDRRVVIPAPDINGREEILNIHITKMNVPLSPDVDIKKISRSTPGFSGADLMNVVNEAALSAAKHDQKIVIMGNFDEARDKILMGVARKSLFISFEERKLTAYHEAGHALLAIITKGSDPIYKATIIPRGHSLGLVMRVPEADRVSITKEKLLADLVVGMGGRAAEELIFGEKNITSGASSDIKMVSKIARSMVYEWGMSDKVGMIFYGDCAESENHYSNSSKIKFSNKTSELLDLEVKKLIENAYNQAIEGIKEKKDWLEKIANNLLEKETLDLNEIKDILGLHEKEELKSEDKQES